MIINLTKHIFNYSNQSASFSWDLTDLRKNCPLKWSQEMFDAMEAQVGQLVGKEFGGLKIKINDA